MRRAAILAPWLALFTACQGPAPASNGRSPTPAGTTADDLDRAAATITAADVQERVAFLASDQLQGRDTPSPGLDRAASYLAGELAAYGFEPAGDEGTYIQRYPYVLRRLDVAGTSVRVEGPGGGTALSHGVDYAVGEGGSGRWSAVYAGTAPSRADAEAGAYRDRAVIVDLPGSYSREWRRRRNAAIRGAREAGAAAVVLLLDSSFDEVAMAELAGNLAAPRRGASSSAPTLFLSVEAGDRLFDVAELDSDARARVAATGAVLLTAALVVDAPMELAGDARPPNVVGVLPGSDPALRAEYVVLSAHMDHVGVGRPVDGDSVYNGADDNASGTTAVLEAAGALATLATPPARSVLILFVSGEEKGLLGSRYFTGHPTVPAGSMVANVNADMVGRNAPDSIVVIGQEYSSLGPLVDSVATGHPALGLTVVEDPWPEQRFFFRSDHFNFARMEIPALFFFNGVHEDYHRPSDESARLDADKAARVARLIFLTVHAIADGSERPFWTEEGLTQVRALTR